MVNKRHQGFFYDTSFKLGVMPDKEPRIVPDKPPRIVLDRKEKKVEIK